jgi:hypothetical protein
MKRFEAWPSGTLPVAKRTRRQLAIVTFSFLDLFPELRDLVYQVLEPWDLQPLLATCSLVRREARRYVPHVRRSIKTCLVCNIGCLPSWNAFPVVIRELYQTGLWPVFGKATLESSVHGNGGDADSGYVDHKAVIGDEDGSMTIVVTTLPDGSKAWCLSDFRPGRRIDLRAPTLAELMADEEWPDVVATARRITASIQ